jgi:hypothetical protein
MKLNAKNERLKRRYCIYLKEALLFLAGRPAGVPIAHKLFGC